MPDRDLPVLALTAGSLSKRTKNPFPMVEALAKRLRLGLGGVVVHPRFGPDNQGAVANEKSCAIPPPTLSLLLNVHDDARNT
jgi:hypothetical protein